MASSLTLAKPVIAEYVSRVEDALTAEGRPVNRVVPLAPGVAPAWDDSCAQLYGRFVSSVPQVGQPGGRIPPCGVSGWTLTLAIAITRCVGVPNASGGRITLPTAEKVSQDGWALLDDAATLESVVKCSQYTRSISIVRPLPEAGGLAGVEIEFTVRLNECGCDETWPAED